LHLFLPHFSQICQDIVNLVYFFKEPALCFIASLCLFFFLVFIILISAFIFIISLLLVLGFACSYFSRSLNCGIRSFIWGLSILLMYALMAIKFSLRTAFALSPRF
jgi:hypothetical protein